MAACAEVTRLVTSATVWVTSWACWDSVSRVPSWVDRAASVAGSRLTGIFSWRLTVDRAGWARLSAVFSLDT